MTRTEAYNRLTGTVKSVLDERVQYLGLQSRAAHSRLVTQGIRHGGVFLKLELAKARKELPSFP